MLTILSFAAFLFQQLLEFSIPRNENCALMMPLPPTDKAELVKL